MDSDLVDEILGHIETASAFCTECQKLFRVRVDPGDVKKPVECPRCHEMTYGVGVNEWN